MRRPREDVLKDLLRGMRTAVLAQEVDNASDAVYFWVLKEIDETRNSSYAEGYAKGLDHGSVQGHKRGSLDGYNEGLKGRY